MRSAQSERELLPQHIEPVKIGNDHADNDAQNEHHKVTKEPPARLTLTVKTGLSRAAWGAPLHPFPVLKTHG